MLDQWHQCAVRSKSEAIREFYTVLLIRVAKEEGRHLWEDKVEEVHMDATMKSFPKITLKEKEPTQDSEGKSHKRVAGAQHGPASHPPISAARKRKGHKHNKDQDEMNDDEEELTSDVSGDEATGR